MPSMITQWPIPWADFLILLAHGVSVHDGPEDDDEWIAARRREFGARIRTERLRQNRTQEWLHLEAGITRWTLQRVEAGEDARISTLLRIARVLDVSIADLLR